MTSTGLIEKPKKKLQKRILITGGSGKLGRELKKLFPDALTPTHAEMDISNAKSVVDYFTDPEHSISLVIHTAAITDVRKCEEHKDVAIAVNVSGTRNIVNAAERSNAKMIHISTACVFNGETAPFCETDVPEPKNIYAMTKLEAEKVVQSYKNHLIIRTNFVAYEPWLFPAAFTDRYGTYLYAHDVAAAIYKLRNKSGTIHVCGKDTLSMYNLAKLTSPDVKPMTMKDYQGPPLTRDMRLISKIVPPFKITLRGELT
jgi:dTDP-4-dehydrorhamnose reductase